MNILEDLYLGKLSEVDRKTTNPKDNDEEYDLYNKLKLTLNPEQSELFDEFVNKLEDNKEQEMQDKYIQGFKTGHQIAIESFNLEI